MLILLCGAGLSISGYFLAGQKQAGLQEARFVTSSDKSIEYLRSNLHANSISLNTLKTFFDVSENIDRAEFGNFVGPLLKDHPSLTVYGWLPSVPHAKRQEFEAQLSEEYSTAATIRDGNGRAVFTLSPKRSEYYPVAFGIPDKIARTRLGVDVASLPQGGPAIETAIQSGEMAASGPTPYTGEFGLNSNIMIFNAVYRKNQTDAFPSKGQSQEVAGIVMALFNVGSLIEKQFNSDEGIVFFIEDVTDPEASKKIYGELPTAYKSRRDKSFLFAGREWRITSTTQHANQPFQWLPLGVLTVGLIFSVFVSLALLSIIRRKRLVEILVNQRTYQLNQTVGKLANSNEDLARFAYVCSHDLQAPLRHIRDVSSMLSLHLEENLTADKEGQKYLNVITEAAERARQLIADILEYSSADRSAVKTETFNANSIVDKLRETLQANLDDRNGQITKDTLPMLQGNKTQFYQLLQNLIKNGLKYQKAETRPHVHISVEETETHWEFAVADNGIGIAEEYQETVFEVFKRLHHQKEFSGTGVGLAICKKITEKHGGSIWVKSQLGRGSTFYFTLLKNAAGTGRSNV